MVIWFLACAEAEKPDDADGDGYSEVAGDCDDARADIHPDQPETCDGIDQDCDGAIDDSPSDATVWYLDEDGDAFGGSETVTACAPPAGAASDATDCDDTDGAVNPGASEICDNGIDDDCDGTGAGCSAGEENAADADLVIDGAGIQTFGGALAILSSGGGESAIVVGAPDQVAGADAPERPYAWVFAADAVGRVYPAAAIAEVKGFNAVARAGAAVAAGFWDGSEVAGVAIGAPGEGAVYFAPGPVTGELDANTLAVVYGGAADQFGSAIAAADLDGDGADELIVGAPQGEYTGAVFVYPGGVPESWEAEDNKILGAATGDRFGEMIVPVPDLAGDGHGGFAVSAPGAGNWYGGAVYLFSAGDDDLGDAIGTLEGTHSGGQCGVGLAFGGDVQSGTLTIGCPGPGSVFSIPASDARGYVPLEGAVPVWSESVGFGVSVVAAGDVDADGTADTLIGYDAPGQVIVRYGSGDPDRTFSGTVSAVGKSLAGPVDGNRDGRSDILFADEVMAAVYLFHGHGM